MMNMDSNSEPTTMAADPRPLYNALRKMHRKTPSFLAQPPSSSNNNSNNPNDPRLRTKSHDVPPRASARSALKAASSLPTLPRAPPRLQAPRSRPPSTHGSSNNDVARGIYTASTPVKQVKQTPPAKPVELDDAVWEL